VDTSAQAKKHEIRKRLRRILAGIAPQQWQTASETASRRLLESIALARAKTVLFYMPTAKELDIGPAAEACLRQGIAVCLPRAAWHLPAGTQDPNTPAITPALVSNWVREELVETKHGIFEPPASAPTVDLARLDLVVVPGLAFDSKGGRLGRGGGFYDRFLSQPGLSGGRAAKVGVGLDEQVLVGTEQLPRDPWDVTLDALVTPTRTMVFARPPGASD
jgi:5-formyltetrahydrofolate cyclo-ligase